MQYLNYHNPNSFINHAFIVPLGQVDETLLVIILGVNTANYCYFLYLMNINCITKGAIIFLREDYISNQLTFISLYYIMINNLK
jgi:hypothetical protein